MNCRDPEGDLCPNCAPSLAFAVRYERDVVFYPDGEHVGRGYAVTPFCGCGVDAMLTLSLSPELVAT